MAHKLKTWWLKLHKTSLGRWLFSHFLGYLIPYSGSINPLIEDVNPGYARVSIRQHRRILNHLNSIHAIALANLGELTTGLALHFAMGKGQRAILVGLNIIYNKKARSKVVAIAKLEDHQNLRKGEHEIIAILRDETGDEVAKVWVKWLLDEKKV